MNDKNGDTFLLQKNARCPLCGGTLKHFEGTREIVIRCINCRNVFRVVDEGVTDGEYTVEVISEVVG